MSTLTAIKPRPYVLTRAVATIELVQALTEDFQVLEGYTANGKKTYSLRIGVIFWLQSTIKGHIEETPRITTLDTDKKELKKWLDLKMVWIARNPFN